MFRTATQFFFRRSASVSSAAFVLSMLAGVSHLLAIVRDRTFAHYLGATAELDKYYAAFRIPDLLFASLASMVAVTVLLPFLVAEERKGKHRARHFLSEVFTVFTATCTVAGICLYAAMPLLIDSLYADMAPADRRDVVELSRILLLSPFLLGLSNIFASITQHARRFTVYAVSPILYNLSIILGVLFLYPLGGLKGVVYGVVLGALLHLLIQIPVAGQLRYTPSLTSRINWKRLGAVFRTSIPRTIGLSANQLAMIILTAYASSMAIGSIGIFQLAFNLQSVPLSLIGVSFSMAAFPVLAEFWSAGNHLAFHDNVGRTVTGVMLWSLPITAAVLVYADDAVMLLLGSGLFGAESVVATARILRALILSVWAQSLMLVYIRALYAAQKSLHVALASIATTILIIFFARFAQTPFELALAYSFGVVTGFGLYHLLYVRHVGELTKVDVRAVKTAAILFGIVIFSGFYSRYALLLLFGSNNPSALHQIMLAGVSALFVVTCVIGYLILVRYEPILRIIKWFRRGMGRCR